MRRLVGLAVMMAYGAVASAQGAAWGHWAAVRELKAGTKIEVESRGSNAAVDLDERCRVVAVDATTLTCVAVDDKKTRLVFPISEIQAVYQVKHKAPSVGAILGLAVTGIFIGGLAAAWAPGIAVGIIGGIIALAVEDNQARQRWWWGVPPPPPQPAERLVLVYHR